MKPKIKDIAQRLGVSPATVCNALGGKDGVNEQTKREVYRVAMEMGYIQNEPQPSEQRAGRGVVSMIVARKGRLGDLYPRRCSLLLESAETALAAQGLAAQVSYFDASCAPPEELRRQIRGAAGEGVLLIATELDDADFAALSPAEQPLVLLDANPYAQAFDAVASNDAQGMSQAVSLLCGMGHTRIGMLYSSETTCCLRRRREGFRSALAANGLAPDAGTEVALRPEIGAACEDMRQYLGHNSSLPTAFVADSDALAVSAMRAAALRGVRVPQELSIVGYGDTSYCMLASAALTSVRESVSGMGSLAARLLLERLHRNKHKGLELPGVTLLTGTELVTRDSAKLVKSCGL